MSSETPSPDTPSSTVPDGDATPTPDDVTRTGNIAWGLLLVLGLFTTVFGVMVLVWPGATLVVLAVMFGLWLIFAGILRLVFALADRSLSMGWRVAHIVLGVLLLGAGISAVSNLVRSLGALVFLAGFLLILDGVDDLMRALRNDTEGSRGWLGFTGVVGVVAGGIVLARPGIGLATLVIVLAASLIALGVARIVAALALRKALATA